MASESITDFHGENFFLSNFCMCTMTQGDGGTWSSVEHFYQAAKTDDMGWKNRIFSAVAPSQAKRLGRKAPKRPTWDEEKLLVMRDLLMDKFLMNFDLREKLINTGDAQLIEGNWWGDTFWGVCNGVGENWLGRLLMEIRDELRTI